MSSNVKAELFAKTVEDKWKIVKSAKKGLFSSSIDLSTVCKFIIQSLDEAIKYAQANLELGPEKKEFVLVVIRRIYDEVIGKNLPYWLYPFSSSIKNIIIDVIISNAIDYFVAKYKEGNWKL